MDEFRLPDVNQEAAIEEMSRGDGFVRIENLFSAEDIQNAKETILYLIGKETEKRPISDSRRALLPVTRNLLEKGEIFHKLVQHPTLMSMAAKTMGSDFQLGIYAGNTVLPGGLGQEPHLDYPYWDYFRTNVWPIPPKHKDIPFFFTMQV